VHCDLAGDGPLRRDIEARISHAALSARVTLRGAVPHDALLEELSAGAYDAAVLASIEEPGGLHEGIPAFLMECMAASVPCIATRTGSIEELVDHGCGVLVAQRDPAALASAIERLAADGTLRRALGDAARERVARDFAAATSSRQLLEQIQGTTSAAMRREMSATTAARP